MRKSIYIIFLSLACLTSCYYIDNESYYAEIESDYQPVIDINSSLVENDTIFFGDSLLFTFEVSIDTGRYYFSDLYLDSYFLLRFTKQQDSIWIPATFLDFPGEFEFILYSFYKSYTGSLADVYNADLLVADSSWNVTVLSNFSE